MMLLLLASFMVVFQSADLSAAAGNPFLLEFLGAANRDAATVPPMAIRRNTSTLNGTFTGNRRITSPVISADARREGYWVKLRQRMVPRYRRASTLANRNVPF